VVDISQKDRTIRLKIVYYGPALGGKTTNLQVLHQKALWARRGEFISVNSMQDRTILCDLLPLRTGGFRGFDLKLQLLAVPGQRQYEATRRVVLKAADGVVFVANSASDRFPENARSYEEMGANLVAHQIDPHTIPLVFQYNKRDLPQIADFATLQQLNLRHVPALPAVATQGVGVLETFSAILCAVVSELGRRYRTMELPAGQTAETWTQQAVVGMFGRERFDAASEEPEAIELPDGTVRPLEGSVHRRVQVSTPEDRRPPAAASAAPTAPTAPAASAASATPSGGATEPDSLAASYAEASAELGFVVSDLREERDAASRRLEEMRQALELATDASVEDVDTQLRSIAQLLMRAGGASAAALRVVAEGAARTVVLPPLVGDAFSRTPWGQAHVEALHDLLEPLVEEATGSAELSQALRAGEPSYEAAVLVPLRSGEQPLALGLLYYDGHAVVPSRDTLGHLGYLAQELAGFFSAAATREAASALTRLRQLTRTSATAVFSLLARLPAGSAKRERLALADLLAPFRLPGITVRLPADGISVLGDAPLLRSAMAALVRLSENEALARGRAPDVTIQAILVDSVACISFSGGVRPSPSAARPESPDVLETELNLVRAIVAAHQGQLTQGQDAGQGRRLTLRLSVG
jgi:signal recognition particle receptor subunit beta